MEKEELKTRLKEAVEEYINAHLSYRKWAISATSRGDKQAPIFKDIVQKHGIVFESIPKEFLNRVENYKAHCEMYARPGEFGDSNYDSLEVEQKPETPYGISTNAPNLYAGNFEELTQELLEEVADNPKSYNALAYRILTDHKNIVKGNENENLTKDQKLELLRAMVEARKTRRSPKDISEEELEQAEKRERFERYKSSAEVAGTEMYTSVRSFRAHGGPRWHADIDKVLSDLEYDDVFTPEEKAKIKPLLKQQYENRYNEDFKGVKNPFETNKQSQLPYDNEHCEVKMLTTVPNITMATAIKYSLSLRIAQKMLENKHGFNPEVTNEINAKFENALNAAELSDERWTTVAGFHYLFPEEEIDKIIKYHESKHYHGDGTFGSHKFAVKNLENEGGIETSIDRQVTDAIFGIIDDEEFNPQEVSEEYLEDGPISDILTFVNHLKEIAKGKAKTSNSNNLDAMLSSAGSQKGKGKSSIYE